VDTGLLVLFYGVCIRVPEINQAIPKVNGCGTCSFGSSNQFRTTMILQGILAEIDFSSVAPDSFIIRHRLLLGLMSQEVISAPNKLIERYASLNRILVFQA
jgi:hypothetical protein